ncbi:peptidylprolyl isomerase [Paenibacillus sp. OV219]|uniref:peptidylprolyl isomerase n=1 Tax=Paenibacillus sp. OV219 TaxID=1884377 RepID=UPI0008C5D03A|nr:peptidylprolyl isomerase [Paenibacillus sp. OV219]SEP02198.1 foldase protein PrsA [Paenibacillus sp. OV219]
MINRKSILFRRVGVALLVVMGLALAAGAGAYAATKMTLIVNGQKSTVEPVSIKGVTYVPLRSAAEMLGASVNYNAASNSVTIAGKPDKSPLGDRGNEAVGSVNGETITKNELYNAMAALGGVQTLDNLIQDKLVGQEAKKKGIVVSDKDVEAEIAQIKKQFPSEKEFESALQQASMTLEDLKKQTSKQLRIRKLIEPLVKVTDADVKQYFDENRAMFDQPEQVKASHILVATKAEADEIMKQLKAGGDFAKLAKEKSLDTGSKDAGGDLGYFGKGVMVAEFEKAAFSLKAGELGGPIKTQFGYHIIKVTDHKAAKAAKFEEHQAEIKELIIRQKVSERSATWLEELKAKAQITNTLK